MTHPKQHLFQDPFHDNIRESAQQQPRSGSLNDLPDPSPQMLRKRRAVLVLDELDGYALLPGPHFQQQVGRSFSSRAGRTFEKGPKADISAARLRLYQFRQARC
jgi:hypothetical protein